MNSSKRNPPLSVRISPELLGRVTKAADAAGVKRNAWIIETIESRLGPGAESLTDGPEQVLPISEGMGETPRVQVAPDKPAVDPGPQDLLARRGHHMRLLRARYPNWPEAKLKAEAKRLAGE